MRLSELNSLPAPDAREALLRCCGSARWADRMLQARPFHDDQELLSRAEQAWWNLSREDWLEAFSHHPRIGGDVESLRKKFGSTAGWASDEQSGTRGASEATLQALSTGNTEYERRFGHVFLICATGKSADEMLQALQKRMPNDATTELKIAAGEQAKITALRLEKLLKDT
jgi:2-oxo-4-hydroxy-4-carboxy-5-ureidoimidazoline decarboxylase